MDTLKNVLKNDSFKVYYKNTHSAHEKQYAQTKTTKQHARLYARKTLCAHTLSKDRQMSPFWFSGSLRCWHVEGSTQQHTRANRVHALLYWSRAVVLVFLSNELEIDLDIVFLFGGEREINKKGVCGFCCDGRERRHLT